jgi:hypothetical protein
MTGLGYRRRVSSHVVVLAAVPAFPLSASRDVPHHTEAGGGQAETAAPTVLAAAVAQPSAIPM